jgi:hypothetical protein
VVAYCTHPVLSGPAIANINNSALDELVVTDTIPLSEAAKACRRIRQLRRGTAGRDDPAHQFRRVGQLALHRLMSAG